MMRVSVIWPQPRATSKRMCCGKALRQGTVASMAHTSVLHLKCIESG